MKFRKNLANAIRFLSIDAVEKAKSGHPGMPMGMADIAEVLWRNFIKHNPENPQWDNRDRFVLSNGHGSMLLYSVLHLSGYKLSIDDLKNFRQLHSKTPGHPEIGYTPGIDTTTGPLGQGLATAIGMAIAEKTLSASFNKLNYNIIDHYTWVFVGDGCLMEGISHESCSLAGTLKLNKLIVFYDNNGISIDGNVKKWFSDDTKKRFESYNWNVISEIDGHDSNQIFNAIQKAKNIKNKPSLIICNTIIGYGSPNKSGTAEVHGAPLGTEEILLTRKKLNWNHPPFHIPKDVYFHWNFKEKGKQLESNWNKLFQKYEKNYPNLAQEYKRRMSQILPNNWNDEMNKTIHFLNSNKQNLSTRQSSQNILEKCGKLLPELLGGSADLAPSNLTKWSKSVSITDKPNGNYIHYGVREFSMTAISNGISQHKGFIPYSATFLIFMEYARNAVRMAALMNVRHLLIYTHDSIGLGEDGPTHQPIEQISNLRSIPNMHVWRPSDQVETAIAWKLAIERKNGPSALILSRQNLIQPSRTREQIDNISRGGYIIYDCTQTPEIILISTGSELNITLQASKKLTNLGYFIRVVSMPCTNIFDKQDKKYKNYVFPKQITSRIAIEAGISDFWYKYVGLKGFVIGMNSFGESAPCEKLYQHFGITVETIVKKAKDLLLKVDKST
ncbi:Transketolase 2 [Buchnera aphidicola (Anoecia corni)]|uniref:Transketolase n=1 Tax=Buchnera aphidicola (Anoecia corni) TaxID=2994477 RepID=A0AAT9IG31_9GAMM